MVNNEDFGKLYWSYYFNMLTDSTEWRRGRDYAVKMYHGDQWSTEAKEVLDEEEQHALVLNSIRPFIKFRAAMLSSAEPSGKVVGMNREDMEGAAILNDLLSHIKYTSTFGRVLEDVVLAQQREGVGFFVVAIDPDADYGRGEIKIVAETYQNIFTDLNVSAWDLSDAPRVIHSKLYDLETFANLYPKYKNYDLHKYALTNDIPTYGTSAEDTTIQARLNTQNSSYRTEFIRVMDVYERFRHNQRVLEYMTGTVVPIDDDYELNADEKQLVSEGAIRENHYLIQRIKLHQLFGNGGYMEVMERDKVLPISTYPIIPVVDEFTGNSLWKGEIDYVAQLQEFKNKAASLMLRNAALTSVPHALGDTNAIPDAPAQQRVEESRRKVGGIAWVPMQNGEWPIKYEQIQPINQAFAYLVQFFTQNIESGMGTFSLRMGDPAAAPNTATLGLSMAEWSKDILRPSGKNLDFALQRTFDIILELIPHVYTKRKVFVVTRGNEEYETQVVNDQVYDEALNEVTKVNDVTELRAKYRIVTGSTFPTNTIAKLALFKELSGLNPVFLKYMVDFLPDLREKDKQAIIAEIDIVPKLQAQIAQYEQALQTTTQELNHSKKRVELAEKRMAVQRVEHSADKSAAKRSNSQPRKRD